MARRLRRSVTYLLGAGASAQAIPVVNKMKDGLVALADCFIRHGYRESIAQKIDEDFRWLAGLHDKYFSIDTVAKIFFHSEGAGSENLKRLKDVVFLYFLLEQADCEEFYQERLLLEPIDSRYYRFLAYYLGNEPSPKLPENLNIISWNYDSQLELAYRQFNGRWSLGETSEELASFPRPGNIQLYERDAVVAKVIHLNGVAGLSIFSEDDSSFHNLFDKIKPRDKQSLLTSLNNLNFYSKYSSHSTLNFAWERRKHGFKHLERAKEIMASTDDLIVIGYSFPNFNRDIDKQLLGSFRSKAALTGTIDNKRIYFQDLTRELRAAAMQDQFRIAKVHPVAGVDEFFIPPNV